MSTKKRIQPGDTVPLKLTAKERKLVLEDLMCLDDGYARLIQDTPTGIPVRMTLDDLDDFGGYIAAEANHCEDEKKQKKLDAIFQKVEDLLAKYTVEEPPQSVEVEDAGKAKETKAKPDSNTLFQFKITLLGLEPPIWRRIQVTDGTLDQLHEHIQTAMGWTSSHLHQFEIKGEHYADPDLWDAEFELVDSTKTNLSQILPKIGERFAFRYEYDFGDGWEHEILFEGNPKKEPGQKYPLCLEGERACPPEDVGGIWGYQNFLAAIADWKHEEHESFLEWCGGSFSPDKFDPKKATREMTKGLPNWRRM